ncbi:MAG: aminoacyl-tRNA hydrolase [Fimbriimonadaceae bacterium]
MRSLFRRKATRVQPLYMIVGLGNPGGEYARTRHNVGFDVVEELAKRHKIKLKEFRHSAKFGVGNIDEVPVALVQPLTFMNRSGQAVAPLLRQFNLKPDRMMVITDDLDLPVGRVKLKPKGSSGGHNGHKSIIASLGTDEYPRLKIGIGSETDDTVKHVLGRFGPDERDRVNEKIELSVQGCEEFVARGLEAAMNRVNTNG